MGATVTICRKLPFAWFAVNVPDWTGAGAKCSELSPLRTASCDGGGQQRVTLSGVTRAQKAHLFLCGCGPHPLEASSSRPRSVVATLPNLMAKCCGLGVGAHLGKICPQWLGLTKFKWAHVPFCARAVWRAESCSAASRPEETRLSQRKVRTESPPLPPQSRRPRGVFRRPGAGLPLVLRCGRCWD